MCLRKISFKILALILLLGQSIQAANMKKMVLQGFLKNGANNLNGTFPMKFMIKKNGTPVYSYCPAAPVNVMSGAFNFQLDDANPSNCSDGAGTNTLYDQISSVDFAMDQFSVDVAVDVNNDSFATQSLFSGINIVSAPFALTCEKASTATTATSATTATTASLANNVTGIVALLNGGTGSSTAAGARANLEAASAGANSDITSLTGLTTPLTSAQGGTGISSLATYPASGTIATVPSGGFVTSNGTSLTSIASIDLSTSVGSSILASTNGGTGINSSATFPASGTIAVVPSLGFVKSDGTSLVSASSIDLDSDTSSSTMLPITKGGTGASSNTQARTNLEAAQSNANSDITSMSSVTSIAAPVASSLTLSSGLNNINVSDSKISNVLNPTANQDAATKVYVDNADSTAVERRYIAQPTSTTLTNSGFAGNITATGTSANVDSNTSVAVRLTSSAAANNCASFVGSLIGRIGQGIDLQAKLRTGTSATTNGRTVFGLSQSGTTAPATNCNAGPAGNDLPSTYSAAYFRYSTASADSVWKCVSCSGAACTTANSTVTVNNNTDYSMRIKINGGNADFYINGILACSITSTLPSSGTNLLPMYAANALSTTAQTVTLSFIRAISQ